MKRNYEELAESSLLAPRDTNYDDGRLLDERIYANFQYSLAISLCREKFAYSAYKAL